MHSYKIDSLFYYFKMMKLLDWIDVDCMVWWTLSENPNAIELLKANLNNVNWYALSMIMPP